LAIVACQDKFVRGRNALHPLSSWTPANARAAPASANALAVAKTYSFGGASNKGNLSFKRKVHGGDTSK
jgi:hypothetical protein